MGLKVRKYLIYQILSKEVEGATVTKNYQAS